MMTTVLGSILTIFYLMNLIPFDGSQILAIWLFVMGASLFVGGHEGKMPGQASLGLVWLVFGLITPIWFAGNFFLIGGLILGLPSIIGGLMMKKK